MNVLYEAIASLHRQVDERIADDATTPCLLSFDRARAVLDALLAQPKQEPVVWKTEETYDKDGVLVERRMKRGPNCEWEPLLTPPRREWVGLTGEDC